MARQPRIYSESGVYHVILRGINREKIFEYNTEKEYMLSIMKRYFTGDSNRNKKDKDRKIKGKLFAFCIMDNHVHFLLKESSLGIANLMQRITTSYAGFFNRRRGRSGHVFESRYTSRPVEGQRYFSNILNYIHNNPVAAGIVNISENYTWSSAFVFAQNYSGFLTKEDPIQRVGKDEKILECAWPLRISDMDILQIINNFCNQYKIRREQISKNFVHCRKIVNKLNSLEGISKLQISRLLYISTYRLSQMLVSMQADNV